MCIRLTNSSGPICRTWPTKQQRRPIVSWREVQSALRFFFLPPSHPVSSAVHFRRDRMQRQPSALSSISPSLSLLLLKDLHPRNPNPNLPISSVRRSCRGPRWPIRSPRSTLLSRSSPRSSASCSAKRPNDSRRSSA